MLLLIHGISQQRYVGKEEELLIKWRDLLHRGLREYGADKKKTEQIVAHCRMIFYADLTDPDRVEVQPGSRQATIESYERMIEQAIANQNAEKRGIQNTAAAHQAVRFADKFHTLRRFMIRLSAEEAYGFFERSTAREEVDSRCDETIKDDQFRAIVSHSFGTVIAYRLLARRIGISPHLITLGSPLAVPFMHEALGARQTKKFTTLAKWHDFSDPEDIVSYVPIDIKQMFQDYTDPPPLFVCDRSIDNTTDNQHSIEGYLAQSRVIASILEAFN